MVSGVCPSAMHVFTVVALVIVLPNVFASKYHGYPSIPGQCGANDALGGDNKPGFGHFNVCRDKRKARDIPYYDSPPPNLDPKIPLEAQWANCSTVIPPDMYVPWPGVLFTGTVFSAKMKLRDWALSQWGKFLLFQLQPLLSRLTFLLYVLSIVILNRLQDNVARFLYSQQRPRSRMRAGDDSSLVPECNWRAGPQRHKQLRRIFLPILVRARLGQVRCL